MSYSSNRSYLSKPLLCLGSMLIFACATGCSGGGGSNSGPAPVALRVTATGASQALWNGSSVGGSQCVQNVGLNAELTFEFGGPVDPASLPQGFASDSLEIRDSAGVPLSGIFTVQDDPALPAGNQRQVVFSRGFPGTGGPGASQGWPGPELWSIRVPGGANAGSAVLIVAGQPLQNEIITCFATCDPGAGSCFADPAPGAAFVVATQPPSGDPTPAAIPTSAITANQVIVTFSEPLDPSTVTMANFQVIEMISGVAIPGTIMFEQAVSNNATSRIIYSAADAFIPGRTFEIVLQPGLVDFGGFSVATAAPGGNARLMFATAAEAACPQPPLTEDFTTTAQRGARSGLAEWEGTGTASARSLEEITGNGSYGPLVAIGGPSVIDTGMAAVPGFSNGTFETTIASFPAASDVRFTGAYPVHVKSLGSVTVDGVINASAGNSPAAPNGSPEAGAAAGIFNNGGVAAVNPVRGGLGGPGGGSGGRASIDLQANLESGETGFGPSINGQPNIGTGSDASSFGGGEGGQPGFRFPAGGIAGDIGGLGAAGGSAFLPGEDPERRSPAQIGCGPLSPGNATPAVAQPSPASFMAPIAALTAGSGGGGGGDRLELPLNSFNNDQGGGGGGGGGGVRISAAGDVDITSSSSINCEGGNGGGGNSFFGGGGGGGSGGLIWLQSLQDLNMSSTASMRISGGSGTNECSDHKSGGGGIGLVQAEDSDGIVNSPMGISDPSAFVLLPTIPASGGPQATVTSKFFDTGTLLPNFTGASATASSGTVPGGATVVLFQGAREAVSGGTPDLGALSPWVVAASIDQLDDFRYVRFRVEFSYQTTPLPNPGETYPSVSSVSINYESTANCP